MSEYRATKYFIKDLNSWEKLKSFVGIKLDFITSGKGDTPEPVTYPCFMCFARFPEDVSDDQPSIEYFFIYQHDFHRIKPATKIEFKDCLDVL